MEVGVRFWTAVGVMTVLACSGATASIPGGDGGAGGGGGGGVAGGGGAAGGGAAGGGGGTGGGGGVAAGGGGSSAGGTGGGGGDNAYGCPASSAVGGACSFSSYPGPCEYGNDPRVGCDPIYVCQGNQWVPDDVGGCGLLDGPDGGNSPACPATFAGVDQGGQCSVSGAECLYPEAFCQCAVNCFGACAGPDSGIPTTWQCDVPDPANGCPIPRPRLGTSCHVPGKQCDYGACSGNIAETCQYDVWVESSVPCPGVASN
jgi:hypothetical protein